MTHQNLSEHSGARAEGQEQEDSSGPGSKARPPGHHQVPGEREEEEEHLLASLP